MCEIYSMRTRKEVKELRKEIEKEERNKRFVKNLPFILLLLGMFIGLISYTISVNKQCDEMRTKIVNDRNLPMSVRKKYMTQDEIKNIMHNQKNN